MLDLTQTSLMYKILARRASRCPVDAQFWEKLLQIYEGHASRTPTFRILAKSLLMCEKIWRGTVTLQTVTARRPKV